MVGHWLNSLMPWRTSSSTRMLTLPNLTPSWLSTSTTAAEKPHCGKTGVPFMNSSTSFLPIVSRMRPNTSGSLMIKSPSPINIRPSRPLRHGGQFQRMQDTAHAAAQRLINHLVLLDLGLAGKGRRNDRSRPMVTVAREILHLDLGVGNALSDQGGNVFASHRHCLVSCTIPWRSYRPAARP